MFNGPLRMAVRGHSEGSCDVDDDEGTVFSDISVAKAEWIIHMRKITTSPLLHVSVEAEISWLNTLLADPSTTSVEIPRRDLEKTLNTFQLIQHLIK